MLVVPVYYWDHKDLFRVLNNQDMGASHWFSGRDEPADVVEDMYLYGDHDPIGTFKCE